MLSFKDLESHAASLMPVKTGEAVLVSNERCPYAERARIARELALESGSDIPLVEVSLREKPEWFVDLCKEQGFKRSSVPMLKPKDALPFNESMVIDEYLIEKFRPDLLEPTPDKKAERRLVCTGADAFNKAAFRLFAYDGDVAEDVTEDQLKADFEAELQNLENRLEVSGGPFLMGEKIGLADVTFAPFALRVAIVYPHFKNGYDPMSDSEKFPRVVKWKESLKSEPAVDAVMPPNERVIEGYGEFLKIGYFKSFLFKKS